MQNARAGCACAGVDFEELSDALRLGRLLRRGAAPLDRRSLAVAVAVPRDLDPARLALLRLRDRDVEDAIVELGGDSVGVDAIRQRQRAAELAERALETEEALLLALVLGLALTGDRERAVV